MRSVLRWRSLMLVVVTLSAGFSLASMATIPAAQGTTTVTGKWNVTYGNSAVVSIKLTGTDAYTMKAVTPIEIVGGSSCRLPKGTVLATFSGSGATLTGQHGLWYTSNCAFAEWTSFTVKVKSSIKLVGHLGDGYKLTMKRVVS